MLQQNMLFSVRLFVHLFNFFCLKTAKFIAKVSLKTFVVAWFWATSIGNPRALFWKLNNYVVLSCFKTLDVWLKFVTFYVFQRRMLNKLKWHKMTTPRLCANTSSFESCNPWRPASVLRFLRSLAVCCFEHRPANMTEAGFKRLSGGWRWFLKPFDTQTTPQTHCKADQELCV